MRDSDDDWEILIFKNDGGHQCKLPRMVVGISDIFNQRLDEVTLFLNLTP